MQKHSGRVIAAGSVRLAAGAVSERLRRPETITWDRFGVGRRLDSPAAQPPSLGLKPMPATLIAH